MKWKDLPATSTKLLERPVASLISPCSNEEEELQIILKCIWDLMATCLYMLVSIGWFQIFTSKNVWNSPKASICFTSWKIPWCNFFVGGSDFFGAFFPTKMRSQFGIRESPRWIPSSDPPRLRGPDVFTYVLERMDSPLGHETTEINGILGGFQRFFWLVTPENGRNAYIMIMYLYIYIMCIYIMSIYIYLFFSISI